MRKNTLLIIALFLISMGVSAQPMILTFSTADGSNRVTLPLGDCDVTVDWGDGTTEAFTTAGNYQHNFSTGVHTITISGAYLTSFGHKDVIMKRLTSVVSFGDLGITSLRYAFNGAYILSSLPVSVPASVTDMTNMLHHAYMYTGTNMSGWAVQNVTRMDSMFRRAWAFDENIGGWYVGNVTSMSHMFDRASDFNQNIGNWNVANVTDMSGMFKNTNFHYSIENWTVDNVTDMSSMFEGGHMNYGFTLNGWNVSKVENMSKMFNDAFSFNQPLGNWVVSNVTRMDSMFEGAAYFNQDLGGWEVDSVTTMVSMFDGAQQFSQDIGAWNVDSVTDFSFMFKGTWFNHDINDWNVGNATTMESMFQSTYYFNQDLSGWDVSNVTNMESMFHYSNFNSNIEGWDVSSVTNMKSMLSNTQGFNRNIGGWDVSNVTNMQNMLDGTQNGLSVENYDALLVGWSTQTLQTAIQFGAENRKYSCIGKNAKDALISSYFWIITDGGIQTTTNPIIPVLNDITASCEATVSTPSTTTDNCTTPVAGTTSDPTTYTAQGTHVIEWTFDDGSGNVVTANQNVIITDSDYPTISCVANQTKLLASGGTSYTVSGTEFNPSANSDNCSGYTMVNDFNSTSSLENAVFPLGSTTVIWTITDIANQESQCSFVVDVSDPFVGIQNISQTGISIFPNPTNGILNFDFANNNVQNIKIIDITGKTIIEQNQINNTETIDLSALKSGIYIIKIQTENEIFTSRIVKK